MNRVSYDLFTTATFTCDEYSCVSGSNSLDQRTQFDDGRMIAYQAVKPRRSKSRVHEMRFGCYPQNLPPLRSV